MISRETPQTRGSTLREAVQPASFQGNPADAGIDRPGASGRPGARRKPRRRGDRPATVIEVRRDDWETPQTRGSTSYSYHGFITDRGNPADAGMDH